MDINESIRQVLEFIRGEAAKHGVCVQTQFADGLPFLEGDRVQLQQVILNLVMNAMEAMEAVGDAIRKVLIRTAPSEDDCVR